MGAGVSVVEPVTWNGKNSNYFADRSKLRDSLQLAFDEDTENQDLIRKIIVLQNILTENAHICATAVREIQNKKENAPTNIESAFRELERLYHVYETGRILKSVACRLGPVACPIGHHMIRFENGDHPAQSLPVCNICDTKSLVSGYTCSYCEYHLCDRCWVIYCPNGHAMKLWTHPESDLSCVVCQTAAISGGYRCIECHEYDICDMCTYKPGRILVRKKIHEKMLEAMAYIANQVTESATAERMTRENKIKEMDRDFRVTTLELLDHRFEIERLKKVVIQEVRLTRITREINRIRAILTVGREYSRMAHDESLVVGTFTKPEMLRLQALLQRHLQALTQVERDKTIVACLLGHAAVPYEGIPETYSKQGITVPPACKICERITGDGYHCDLCEYDLCRTCAVIYCGECHTCTMWTIPEALPETKCYLCSTTDLTQGYYCSVCDVNMCNLCTRKSVRDQLRVKWENEMAEILAYLHENRKLSDEAAYYSWRQANYIVSPALLCQSVLELRTARVRTYNQVKYKAIIDKIKLLRKLLTQNAKYSKMAQVEAARDTNYHFTSKKEAKAELKRIMDIDARCALTRTIPFRATSRVACPLAHGMVPLEITSGEISSDVIDPCSENGQQPETTMVVEGRLVHRPHRIAASNLDSPIACKLCDDEIALGTIGWNTCSICEYSLCKTCSVVYCREGHPCVIWTVPEALGLECNFCRQLGIMSGYRCHQCNVDICDLCTAREAREAAKQWPMRELKRAAKFLESIAKESNVAAEYLKQGHLKNEKLLKMSMSALCDKLAYCKQLKDEIDQELGVRRLLVAKQNYIKTTRDL